MPTQCSFLLLSINDGQNYRQTNGIKEAMKIFGKDAATINKLLRKSEYELITRNGIRYEPSIGTFYNKNYFI